MISELMPVHLAILAIHGIAIFGLFKVLRKAGISSKTGVFLSFLIFGFITGLLVVWVWPYESAIYINTLPVIIGDELYSFSINQFGDPGSRKAHYTIPWILRIPQVYVISSAAFWGMAGLIAQIAYIIRAQ